MRRYTLRQDAPQYDAAAGDEIELDIDAATEAGLVASGWLEVVPGIYRVTGAAEVHGAQPGETFEAALPADQEAALLAGGHVEQVEVPSADEATKSELLEQARELEIEGRSQMSKDELAEAIASALTEDEGR